MALKLAIVGRPNVGKSTLFNRLAGKRLAIVDDRPGVTRDRRHAPGRLGDIDLDLIDTAGFEDVTDESLEARMRTQTELAVAEADIVLMLTDARVGVTPADERFADLLRRSDKPVILAANKAEGRSTEGGVFEAFALGLGEPIPIAAEHGEGMSDLFAAIVAASAKEEDDPEADDPQADDASEDVTKPVRIAIIGRPNAGKSTLVNAILGEDRVLTGPEAGITRDAISIDFDWGGRAFRIVDTAGMRRKAKVDGKLEEASVADTIRSIRFADVCVLVMDCAEALEKQDLTIGDLVIREGRALVCVLAKWDKETEPRARFDDLRDRIGRALPQAKGAALVPVSAIAEQGLGDLRDAILEAYRDWNARVKTNDPRASRTRL
jgi:GTP-binding protein